MPYVLEFIESALKEWKKLDSNTRKQLTKKLAERCEAPHNPASKLHGAPNRYKIKLRTSGYRLIYEVEDKRVVVVVIAIGKRDNDGAYKLAAGRRLS